jgi:hypothetical protein
MHDWSEDDFDFASLNKAANYLHDRCRQFARMGVHTKEKWGTLRVSTTLAYWNYWPVYSLFYPGYCYYHWPRWLVRYMEHPLAEVFMSLGVTRLVNRYQTWVLKYFWKRAAKKWPHISKEILNEYYWTFNEEAPDKRESPL